MPKRILFLAAVCLVMSIMFIGLVKADYQGNRSLLFDGVDDYIGFGGFALKNFTIELWIQPYYGISAGSNLTYGHERGYLISIGDGIQAWFNYADGNFYVGLSMQCPGYTNRYPEYKAGSQVWESSSWYHIAIVYNDRTVLCYLNASPILSQVLPDAYGSPYSIFYDYHDGKIGTSINDNSLAFKGSIDEVRYWNITLTN